MSECETIRGTCLRPRLVRLQDLEAPFPLSADETAAYLRRFATLFADDARSRRGGLGRVTHVTNALGEQYALKTLVLPAAGRLGEREAAEREETLRQAFRHEYELQRSLVGLRGFPRLYGYGSVDGTPAIVMEWVEGPTLEEARLELAVDEGGRVSPLTAARIGAELFELVSRLALVGDGLVHRDLSPANVMVRTRRLSLEEQRAAGAFDLCVIDFGSTAETRPAGGTFTGAHAAVRHATADYAPPEMLSDDIASVTALRRSAAIDVYAAASILCELVGGAPPFSTARARGALSPYRLKTECAPERPVPSHAAATDLGAVLAREPEEALVAAPLALGRGLSPNARELRRALALADEQLVDALMTCLEVDPRRRPDAATMRDELRGFCERYRENVTRALAGEPLEPCMTGEAWLETEPPRSARRLGRSVGRVCSLLVWTAVIATTAVLVGELPLRAGGALAAPALAALLAAPAVTALLARGRNVTGPRGLARGSTALLASASLVAGALLALTDLGGRWPGIMSAVIASTAAAWLPLVLDYACAAVPPLVREARRELPNPPDNDTPGDGASFPEKGHRRLEG